jgi:hypothetical protein
MLSLQNVLPRCPDVIIKHIQSYLTLDSLGAWRATNRQAYQDVEQLVHVKWIQFPKLVSVPQHSLWMQFLSQVYTCSSCFQYDTGAADAEAVQLCQYCFVMEHDVMQCESCTLPFFLDNGETCTECDQFYCDQCYQEGLQFCLTCSFLFCSDCLTDHLES